MSSKLRTASWVLLTIIGSLTLLVSFASAYLAYRGDYPIGGIPVAEVASGRQGLQDALRGVRGTSAAYGAGFAVLFLATVLGPYRRGDTGAWWGLFFATVTVMIIAAARVPLLGIPFGPGVGPALAQGTIILLGLLLDVGRLRSR